MKTTMLVIILLGVILSLVWLCLNNLKKINISSKKIQELEHLLEEERSKASFQDKYNKLEAKVRGLNASAQTIGSAEAIEDQITQLEDFFDSHFKTQPPYVSKFCKRMKRMVLADERIMQLHGQVMRPLQGMLYTQEITDAPEVQRMVLARMIDALWMAFDAVETIADGDNIRPEQQLVVDYLCGKSTRAEIMNEAKIVTTDPEQTPKWVRVIRRAVLPLRLDEQYPVLYSGYKLESLTEDVGPNNETATLAKEVETTEKVTGND